MRAAQPNGDDLATQEEADPGGRDRADGANEPHPHRAAPRPDRPGAGAQFVLASRPRALPLSDSTARALVTPRAETRPANAVPNLRDSPRHWSFPRSTTPSSGGVQTRGHVTDAYNPLIKYVTGGFTGTTDEIIQWAAHKWGIPEDILRAVAVNESDLAAGRKR